MITPQAVDDLQLKVTNILGEFRQLLSFVDEMRLQDDEIKKARDVLHREQNILFVKQQELTRDRKAHEENKETLRQHTEKVIARDVIVTTKEEQLERKKREVQEQLQRLEAREAQMRGEEEKLKQDQERIARQDALNEKREYAIKEQIAIDRERKIMLDKREEKLKQDQERLQRYLDA